ncbi:MAG: hypothetical protein Pars2KO_10800 [Parasphingorhabdus sp.]
MRWLLGVWVIVIGSFLPTQQVSAQVQTSTQQVSEDSTPDAKEATRYFLFIGTLGPEAWQLAQRNPADQRERAKVEIAELGGTLVGYFFGAYDNKNYSIVSLPDTKTVKAIQVLRMSSGLLADFNVIELIDSSDMPAVLQYIEFVSSVDRLEIEE